MVTGVDYTQVLERYDRAMRLMISFHDPSIFMIAYGVTQSKVTKNHAW